MNEKKKITVLVSVLALIVFAIVAGTFIENGKSKKYLKDFYSAFKGEESKLVMIGRDDCGWCQLFHPSLEFMSEKYGFEYLYVNTNKLTSSVFNKFLKDISVDSKTFGTPLTVVVKNGEIVDSLNGFTDEKDLLTFLQDNGFVKEDASLPMRYIDYKKYSEILKYDDTRIVVVGQTGCQYCIKSKPILNQIISDFGIKIYYLNITDLSSDDKVKFNDSLEYLKNTEWGTPLTLILKKGKVIDSANGLLDYDGYVELFKKNNIIK